MRFSPAWIVLAFAAAHVTAAADAPTAPRITLNATQRESLKDALRADTQAIHAFEPIKATADRALKENPRPVKRIVSEGRLHSDPEKTRSLEARRDLFKIEALGYAYIATDRPEYGDKGRQFILAWARAYVSDGNPINETEFVRLMKGYDLTRTLFSATERGEIEGWLLRMAEKEKTSVNPAGTSAKNNHYSHRLKIIGHVAYLLADSPLIRWTVAEYRRHLEGNLNPDGSTFDFHQRDALHYHVYDLLPLVELCLAAEQSGDRLYDYATSKAATLEKAIAFLIPYITGEKTHREFVHSTVKFDRERSDAGDPSIRVGSAWKPEEARRLFDLAGYFSPRFHTVQFPGGGGESFERLLAMLGRRAVEKK
jgi:hypothetical protein